MSKLKCEICEAIVDPLPYTQWEGGYCLNYLCKECREEFKNGNYFSAVKGAEKARKVIKERMHKQYLNNLDQIYAKGEF